MTDVAKLYTVTDSLGTFLTKVVLEEIRNLRLMWAVTPKQQQDELIDRVTNQIDQAVKVGARKILSAGFPNVQATLQQITVKDGVKATLVFDRADEALDALTHRVGSNLVMVLADPVKFTEGLENFAGDDDQNPLPLGEPNG